MLWGRLALVKPNGNAEGNRSMKGAWRRDDLAMSCIHVGFLWLS